MAGITDQVLSDLANEIEPPEHPYWEAEAGPVDVGKNLPTYEDDYDYDQDWSSTCGMCYDGGPCSPSCGSCDVVDEEDYHRDTPEHDIVYRRYEIACEARRKVAEELMAMQDSDLMDDYVPVLSNFRHDITGHSLINLTLNSTIYLMPTADLVRLRVTDNMEGLEVLTYDEIPDEVFEWEMMALT